MQFPLETLAAIATILGTAVSLVGLVQSATSLAVTSFLFVCISVAALLYARYQRLRVAGASTVIDGQSLDSLNIANLKRRINQTLVVQEAHHSVRIQGEQMEIAWTHSGYCKAARETAMEFSIDSEDSTPFAEMRCVGFDLKRDPEMAHEIRPYLVGPTGISTKIAVPFLEPLASNQPFSVMLKFTLPRCVTVGTGYYTSTLSFAQDVVPRSTVQLIFEGSLPSWVRVYEGKPQAGEMELLRTLAPVRRHTGITEYIDVAENRKGRSARVYSFWRDAL
jgi:hypothetical protein